MEIKKIDATGFPRVQLAQGTNAHGNFSLSATIDGHGILIEYPNNEAYVIELPEIVKESLTYFIPEGSYCEGCPFWGIDKDHPDLEQENGYCSFLEKSDWDLNSEKKDWKIWKRGSSEPIVIKNTAAHDTDFKHESILWDKCKMCGIKDSVLDDE